MMERKNTTPISSSAIFWLSPVPSHISSSGMNAGAGKYRQAPRNGLSTPSTRAKAPISSPSGSATDTASPKLTRIRRTLASTSPRKAFSTNSSCREASTRSGPGNRRSGARPALAARYQPAKNTSQPALPSSSR